MADYSVTIPSGGGGGAETPINQITCDKDVVVTGGSTHQSALEQIVSYVCNGLPLGQLNESSCCEEIIVPQGSDVQGAIDSIIEYFCERLDKNLRRTPLSWAISGIVSYNSGDLFPPQRLRFDLRKITPPQNAHSEEPCAILNNPPFFTTRMEYNHDEPGRGTIWIAGTYRATLNLTCQIENDVNPVSTLRMFMVTPNINAPTKVLCQVQSRNSGTDKQNTYSCHTIFTVTQASLPFDFEIGVAVEDPNPTELISIIGQDIVGNTDVGLTNFEIELIDPFPILPVIVPP